MTTYLPGIDLLTAKGVVVVTHGGGFACNTRVVEFVQWSTSLFLIGVTNLAKGGSSASCDSGHGSEAARLRLGSGFG